MLEVEVSVRLSDLVLPVDWVEVHGRKDAWHGDTHTPDGKFREEAKGKPRVAYVNWSPASADPAALVDELRITYDDGVVVRVPAEEFKR